MRLYKTFKIAFEFLIVLLFLIFEELIWEGIAKPIYSYINSFRVLQKLQNILIKQNRYIILITFLSPLAVVEFAGFYSGILFLQGKFLLGLILYLSKIPLSAFTFWIFKVTKEKLLKFNWFFYSYNKILSFLEWIKSRKTYQKILLKLDKVKEKIKSIKSSGNFKKHYLYLKKQLRGK